MDPAERKRQSRAKQKEDTEKWRVILEKEKQRSHRRRMIAKEKMKENPEYRMLCKEKERLKKKRYREKKKAEKADLVNSELGSYKSKRTLRKAVKKTLKSMPESPTKRHAVVRQIVKDVIPTLELSSGAKTKSQRSDVISTEDKKAASDFFEHDDISRVAPGRKDTMSIKDPLIAKRTHVAKRHMNMSVAEAFQLFKEKYPEAKLGKSKFFELRPVYVRPMNQMPHNVCVCPYHADYSYMVETLHKTVPNFPSTSTELLQEITCDIYSENCMTEQCVNCFEVNDIVNLKINKESTMVSWKYWKKTDKNHTIATASGTLQELLNEITRQTPKFKTHVFVKDQQSKHIEKKRIGSSSTELVLQVDFAENFAILCQDEIQSAHWSHPQATMFTGCAWANGGIDKHSYLILSNEMHHDKFAVWMFMKKIIEDLKLKYPMLKKVFIFSDGCAAQFKNRFTLVNICYAESDWGVNVEWSFFASSLGKGAMDGVGATAKRLLWSAIMTRKQIIADSWDCFDYLKSRGIKGMEIYLITSGDIEEHKNFLLDRWKNTRAIPNIQKQHHFEARKYKCINFGITASSTRIKELMVLGEKLRYEDVYSSSDEDVPMKSAALHTYTGDVVMEDIPEPAVVELIDFTCNAGSKEKPDEPIVTECVDSANDVMMEVKQIKQGLNETLDDSVTNVSKKEKPKTVTEYVDFACNVIMEKTQDDAVIERIDSSRNMNKPRDPAVAGFANTAGDVSTKEKPVEPVVAECLDFASKVNMNNDSDKLVVIKHTNSENAMTKEKTPDETEESTLHEAKPELMEIDFELETDLTFFDGADTKTIKREKPYTSKYDANKIKPGIYLLVKIKANKAKNKEYRFVAVCQGDLDKNFDVKVMFMKSCNKGNPCNQVFTMNEDDVSYINFDQIIKILPEPGIKVHGDRIYYEFIEKIDL